jgi:23S rRNA (uracil1939-C5)-methyltransferase
VSRRQREIDVDVTQLSESFDGIAAFDGRDVRVRATLPGEHVTARVLKRHRGTWYALPLSRAPDAAGRQTPACAAFPRCGGCVAQHLPGEQQLQLKSDWLVAALTNAGVPPARIDAPVAGPLYYYRRKARLAARYLPASGEALVGFREAFGSRVTRTTDCPVLVRPLASLLAPLARLIAGLSVRDAVPQIEVAAGDDRAALVVRHIAPLDASDRHALGAFARGHGVDVLLQSGGYDSVCTIDGDAPEPLLYRLDDFGIALEFEPTDFVQVNATINAALVAATIQALALRPGDHVLDLFCGIGNFTLPMVRRGVHATGLEGSPALVARARHNARCNGLATRAEFATADLYLTDAALPEGLAFNKVLLDPPRPGAGAMISHLTDPGIERVAYVSCHPQSFVADAKALVAAGYDFAALRTFDMFPHTTHVETLGVFIRR